MVPKLESVLHTLIRMIESEDVIFSENDSRARFQNNGIGYFPAVDVNEGSFSWY